MRGSIGSDVLGLVFGRLWQLSGSHHSPRLSALAVISCTKICTRIRSVGTDQKSAFELAQSGGAEQNSVSICIVTVCEATFFNRWSGADGEKSLQIKILTIWIEVLKL